VLEHSGRTDSDLIVPSVREPTRFGILKRYLCRAAAGRESRAARSFCAGLARISCANSHRIENTVTAVLSRRGVIAPE
jgi:hypothetical protein